MIRIQHSPLFRLFLDKLLHQIFTFGGLDVDNLDTFLFQVILATNKGVILAEDNALDFVEDACTSAHVAGRESRVHSSALIGRSMQTASILKSIDFGL